MIKINWNISDEERNRILNLHEDAVKRFYLKEEEKIPWSLCSYLVTEQNGKYFTEVPGMPGNVEIPKLSELQGVIEDGDIVFGDVVENGIELGEIFNSTTLCANKKPSAYAGYDALFVYFDDLKLNVPCFGVLGWKGKLQLGQSDFMGQEIPKDKNGVVIKYLKSRSKSFVLEVAPAVLGRPYKTIS